jgi:hypothetical protein
MTKTETLDKTKAAEPETNKTAAPGTADDKQLPAPAGSTAMVAGSSSDMMEQYAGAGMENVRVGKDTLIPRLTILQALSPQLDRNKPDKYIKEATRGVIFDTGFKELFEGQIIFLPVYFMTQFLEWRPNRKGLAGIHNDPSILNKTHEVKNPVTGAKQLMLDNGNIIAETAQFFGLNVTANYRFSFIPMTSTQLKKARFWNTLATDEVAIRKDGSSYTPPLFYRSYKLGSVGESNEHGNWDGWTIERDKKIDDMGEAKQKVFELAVKLYESIRRGEAKGDIESLQEEEQTQMRERAM